MAGQDWIDLFEGVEKRRRGTKPAKINVVIMDSLAPPSRGQGMAMGPRNGQGNGMGYGRGYNLGSGPDGVVQPSRPAAVDYGTNPPSVYHEGETVVPFPGGKNIVPARTEHEQSQIAQEQQRRGWPGYQTGGTTYDLDPRPTHRSTFYPNYDPTGRTTTEPRTTHRSTSYPNYDPTGRTTTEPRTTHRSTYYPTTPEQAPAEQPAETTDTTQTNNAAVNADRDYYSGAQRDAYGRIVDLSRGADPYMETVRNRTYQDYDARAATYDTQRRQQLASSPDATIGAQRASAARQESRYLSGLNKLSGDLAEQTQNRMERANRDVFDLGRQSTRDIESDRRWQGDFDIRSERWDEDLKDRTWERAIQAYDPATPEGLATLQDIYVNQFGGKAPDLNELTEMREYAQTKRGQDVGMGEIDLATREHTLTEMRNSYTGEQVYDYYQSHPDASWRTDWGAHQAMRVHYDTLGGQEALGEFDAWADSQESALTDPRVTTLIGKYRSDLDNLVGAGILDEGDADDMFDFFTDWSSGKLQKKTIWTVDGKDFDSEQGAIDYANENGIDTSNVKSRWSAVDQTTGEVYGGGTDSTYISATTYGTLNGMSYGSGDLTGHLANGEEFSIDGSMSVGQLGYNLPKGAYTVETDSDGNVWYKSEDGKYYISKIEDAYVAAAVSESDEMIAKASDGINEKDIGMIYQKPADAPDVDYAKGSIVEGPAVINNTLIQGMKGFDWSIKTGDTISLDVNEDMSAESENVHLSEGVSEVVGDFTLLESKEYNVEGSPLRKDYHLFDKETGEKIIVSVVNDNEPYHIFYTKVSSFDEVPKISLPIATVLSDYINETESRSRKV